MGDRFTATHVSLKLLIKLAYNVQNTQITGGPDWLESQLYDLDAKAAEGVNLTREQLRPRLQALLSQRFALRVHEVQSDRPGYALIVGAHGTHLTPTKGDHFPGFRSNVSPGQMRGFNWSMTQFAAYLTEAAGFPVMDQTGLSGGYDVSFSYAATNDPSSDLLPLSDALKQATGLVLKSEKVPTAMLVIDSVSRTPTSN